MISNPACEAVGPVSEHRKIWNSLQAPVPTLTTGVQIIKKNTWVSLHVQFRTAEYLSIVAASRQ